MPVHRRPRTQEPRLVAGRAGHRDAPSELRRCPIRWARSSTTPRSSRRLDLNAVIKDLHCLDDGLAGVVAGRLRPLRRTDDPPGVARRGHLPHHRRPRRRRRRPAALRAAELVAGQRQPRQGAPAAVADQAEVRQETLLGRPDGPRRQRRARVDGLQDVRFRRRPRRRVGAGRAVLGSRGHVARRRTLQRRTPACGAARRGADGPDLRQSGRAERQSGPDRGGQGHPRDVLPHGDERRGDRRADRRRPHLRQDPRRRRSVAGRTGPGKRRARGSGPRLEEQVRAPASAPTPSPAARKSPGRRRRPSGATTSSRTCSRTNGS